MICIVWLMVVIDGEVIMLLRPHGSPDECILFESVYIDWSSKLLIYRNMDSSKFWHCIWLGKLENSFILLVPVSIFIGAFVRMFCFFVIMYLMDMVNTILEIHAATWYVFMCIQYIFFHHGRTKFHYLKATKLQKFDNPKRKHLRTNELPNCTEHEGFGQPATKNQRSPTQVIVHSVHKYMHR